jgi:hypothetical protein
MACRRTSCPQAVSCIFSKKSGTLWLLKYSVGCSGQAGVALDGASSVGRAHSQPDGASESPEADKQKRREAPQFITAACWSMVGRPPVYGLYGPTEDRFPIVEGVIHVTRDDDA